MGLFTLFLLNSDCVLQCPAKPQLSMSVHAPLPILMYTNLAQTVLGLLGSLLLCQVTIAVTLAHCVICEFC